MNKYTKDAIDTLLIALTFHTMRDERAPNLFVSRCKEMDITVTGGSYEAALAGCRATVIEKLKSPSVRNVITAKLNSVKTK